VARHAVKREDIQRERQLRRHLVPVALSLSNACFSLEQSAEKPEKWYSTSWLLGFPAHHRSSYIRCGCLSSWCEGLNYDYTSHRFISLRRQILNGSMAWVPDVLLYDQVLVEQIILVILNAYEP
jgi:hypothetical protein